MIDTADPHRGRQPGSLTSDGMQRSLARLSNRAEELVRANHWAEAITVNQEITKLAPDNYQAWSQLGICFANTGESVEAIASYRKALAIIDDATLENTLGVLLMDAGDGEGAAAAFQKATEIDPASAVAYSNLGIALRLNKNLPGARQALEKSLAIDPKNADAHGNLGNLLRDLGEMDGAVRSLQESIRLRPDRSEAHAFLAGALLEAQRPAEALVAVDNALRLDPINRTAFAYKAVALQETGDLASAKALLDLDNLVDSATFTRAAGFTSIDAFNESLAQHVLQHPTLSFERTGNATRSGSHTSNLLAGNESLVLQFEEMINERIRQYFSSRKIQPAHPFMAHRMKSWRTVAWGVVMRTGGHQIPHIHPSAWLSGVYYVRVPPSVRQDSASKQGWIEFGSPPEKLQTSRQQLKKFFYPEAGKMIVFPSYFYHRTVPLDSDDERISIAFDVSPGAARPAGG